MLMLNLYQILKALLLNPKKIVNIYVIIYKLKVNVEPARAIESVIIVLVENN